MTIIAISCVHLSSQSRRGLWEVRSSLTQDRIGRVLFVVYRGQMVLLHGFIKKTQQTPGGS